MPWNAVEVSSPSIFRYECHRQQPIWLMLARGLRRTASVGREMAAGPAARAARRKLLKGGPRRRSGGEAPPGTGPHMVHGLPQVAGRAGREGPGPLRESDARSGRPNLRREWIPKRDQRKGQRHGGWIDLVDGERVAGVQGTPCEGQCLDANRYRRRRHTIR